MGFSSRSLAMAVKGRLVAGASLCHVVDMEIVFSITQETDGGFVAECLSHDIFTQGDTWDGLRTNVKEAVSAYFIDQPKPSAIRLHLVRDEVLAVA
jgi:predicted RNase H-like HicB family nuclease